MTSHRNANPVRPDSAPEDSGPAGVREIYPGATLATPVRSSTRSGRPAGRLGAARRWRKLRGSETGMATAEYAIATLAAVGFAGLLVLIMRSDEVRGFLLSLIRTALTLP